MDLDLLDLYERASAWDGNQAARCRLSARCSNDIRALGCPHPPEPHAPNPEVLRGGGTGEEVTLSLSEDPPDVPSDDPCSDFERAHAETFRTFGERGVLERTGQALGNVFGDQLVHGWDLAVSTGQDPTMPEGLLEAAFALTHGRWPEEQRKGVFKPEIRIAADTSAQEKLLAYSGRDPSRRQ